MVHEKRDDRPPSFVRSKEFTLPTSVCKEDVVEYELAVGVRTLHFVELSHQSPQEKGVRTDFASSINSSHILSE